MKKWRNDSGKPLSSLAWLEAHHAAKIKERTEFVLKILETKPRRIIDLGCGPGIWLDLFSQHMDAQCELVGIDSDSESIDNARMRAQSWPQRHRLICMNLDTADAEIPEGDVYLAFNIFPYIKNLKKLLALIAKKKPKPSRLFIRQYDGALLRLGPMSSMERIVVDASLQAAVLNSEQFKHYDMDRVIDLINSSEFVHKKLEFDKFERFSPYSREFSTYVRNCADWMAGLVNEEAQAILNNWIDTVENGKHSYCLETELVACLS